MTFKYAQLIDNITLNFSEPGSSQLWTEFDASLPRCRERNGYTRGETGRPIGHHENSVCGAGFSWTLSPTISKQGFGQTIPSGGL